MVFSSHLFIFYFLPITLLIYYLVPRRGKHLALTLLSYIFYGWANPWFIFLMLFSTVVDYLCGLAMTGNLNFRKIDSIETLEPGGPLLPSVMAAEWPKSKAQIRFRIDKWKRFEEVNPESIQFRVPRACGLP